MVSSLSRIEVEDESAGPVIYLFRSAPLRTAEYSSGFGHEDLMLGVQMSFKSLKSIIS
jgi:hypothetical protein